MYFNFATNNSTIFGNVEIKESKPDDVKYLVITALDDFRVVDTEYYFGNNKFWDEIEKTLEDKVNSHDEL